METVTKITKEIVESTILKTQTLCVYFKEPVDSLMVGGCMQLIEEYLPEAFGVECSAKSGRLATFRLVTPGLKIIRDVCKSFLDNKDEFEWFIVKYFGKGYFESLIILAEAVDGQLITELNDVWFKLPDHIFNIKENPKGWSKFLSILEM